MSRRNYHKPGPAPFSFYNRSTTAVRKSPENDGQMGISRCLCRDGGLGWGVWRGEDEPYGLSQCAGWYFGGALLDGGGGGGGRGVQPCTYLPHDGLLCLLLDIGASICCQKWSHSTVPNQKSPWRPFRPAVILDLVASIQGNALRGGYSQE